MPAYQIVFTHEALVSGFCKESKLDEICQLYEPMVDKGLS